MLNGSRKNSLVSLRRVERARALDALQRAAAAFDRDRTLLSTEEERIVNLRAALQAAGPVGVQRAAALVAADADRSRKTAALTAAEARIADLRKHLTYSTAAYVAAQDDLARAQRALTAVEPSESDPSKP